MKDIYLKELHLVNFMGYKDTVFKFFDENGKRKPLVLMYAPNGAGKSSLLNGIQMASNCKRLQSRDNTTFFRKLVFSQDYDSNYQALYDKLDPSVVNKMFVEAKYDVNGEEKIVQFDNSVILKNEVDELDFFTLLDADHPMNVNKFQLENTKYAKKFIELCKVIYNYECYFDKEISDSGKFAKDENEDLKMEDDGDNDDLSFFTDFVIQKYGINTHFKQMSGGERKIATLMAQICDEKTIDKLSIIAIDSFEKEIYFTRQGKTVDKLISEFPDKQFFIVTHSETLIRHVENTYGKECLYDIGEYRMKDYNISEYKN